MSSDDFFGSDFQNLDSAKIVMENNELERNQLWVQEEHDNPGPVTFTDQHGKRRTMNHIAYQLWRERNARKGS